MKLCWDNIENIRLSKYGNFYDIIKKATYYLKICLNCGEEYLGSKKSKFCEHSCSVVKEFNGMYNKTHTDKAIEKMIESAKNRPPVSEETKRKMSESHIGNYPSEETKRKISKTLKGKEYLKGKDSRNWKGGVTKFKLPLYDTYAHQIEWAEEVRRNIENPNILEVKCFKCGEWFIPNYNSINNRIQFLKGNEKYRGEFNLYCSKECKNTCSIYGMKPDVLIKRDEIKAGVFKISEFKLYRKTVDNLSNRIYNKFPKEIINSSAERGRNKYHLDHIYSIKEGFINNIPEYVISSPVNLRMIKESDNISKGCKCDMSKSELISKFNNFIFTETGCIFTELIKEI